jgi:hypothetical protein
VLCAAILLVAAVQFRWMKNAVEGVTDAA